MVEDDFEVLDGLIRKFITVKTPREIGVLAGVEPEVVLRRAQVLKDEIDVLSLEEQITFLMFRLNGIAADAELDAAGADFRDKGALYSAAVGAIRESLRQANLLRKSNELAVGELNRKRVVELLRLFDVIVGRGVAEVSDRFGLDESVLLEVFRGHVVGAARELDEGGV